MLTSGGEDSRSMLKGWCAEIGVGFGNTPDGKKGLYLKGIIGNDVVQMADRWLR